MCFKRAASDQDTSTSFLDRTAVKRARFVKNDSIHSMSSNSQEKQQKQDGLPSTANTNSVVNSSTPHLSARPSNSNMDLLAPKRAVSCEDKEHDCGSSSSEKSKPFHLAPRFALRPNPFIYSLNESFSVDEMALQIHRRPRRISGVDEFNQDDVLLTPSLYPSSSDCMSPPSVPKHDREEDYIVVHSVPIELMLPVLT